MERLQSELEANPELDLVDAMLRIRREMSTPRKKKAPPLKLNFCQRLITRVSEAEIIYPLSDAATNLLAKYASTRPNQRQPLVQSLKAIICSAKTLFEWPVRGVVLKCNDEIAAKIMFGNSDYHYTEYTAIQYLASHAPHIPAPKPHGLIKLANVRIMFMTYFPSMSG